MIGDLPLETYKEEAYEYLDSIEQQLIVLEKNSADSEVINDIFRALHTIKGSGSMFGFEKVSSFTHHVESLFDTIRKGQLSVSKEIITVTLDACDYIRQLLDTNEEQYNDDEANSLAGYIRNLLIEKNNLEIVEEDIIESLDESASPEHKVFVPKDSIDTYRIQFIPSQDLFFRGINPVLLLNELKELGNCYIYGHCGDVPSLDKLKSEECYLSWTILLTTKKGIDEIQGVFIFVEQYCRVTIDLIDSESENDYLEEEDDYKRIGDILLEKKDITKDELKSILKEPRLFGVAAVEKAIVTPNKVEAALAEQNYIRKLRKQRKIKVEKTAIRVKNEKLDDLVNLVGELVTLQARLGQYTQNHKSGELISITESFERLINNLRDDTLSLRMIPLSGMFSSFHRLVRDLGNDLEKEVILETIGTDTELDKNVIDSLKDPLVHIIRNSIDHGIENPAYREEIGKPREGKITISAKYAGANVLIDIFDDGKGLDKEKIHKKAVERGLISEDIELSDEKIYSYICEPGFSTKEVISNVSGRGVGMDVVKKNIENLRGTVLINSEYGKGTRVSISIPLTLAIIDGLLVRIDNEYFIINVSYIEECLDLDEGIIVSHHKRELANVRGSIVPYISLRRMFSLSDEEPDIQQLIVLQNHGEKIGVVVDQVVGHHQTVIKPVSRVFKRVEEISGATILGNGRVALILDVNRIISKYKDM